MRIPESELILNKDGSIYHLNLLPEDIADIIFIVGDPDRVANVSCYFDRIEVRKQKREFISHTGYLGNKRLTVLSTGISTANIDIALNELDALANIDFKTRTVNPTLKSLRIIRLGTSGALQKDIPVNSIVTSQRGLGLDGLASYYDIHYTPDEMRLTNECIRLFNNVPAIQNCYAVEGDGELINLFGKESIIGSTVTAGGFYAAQGRVLRGPLKIPDFIEKLQKLNMTNFEMETAALYAMGRILGHRTCTVNVIVANRETNEYSFQPAESVDAMIRFSLEKIASLQETTV